MDCATEAAWVEYFQTQRQRLDAELSSGTPLLTVVSDLLRQIERRATSGLLCSVLLVAPDGEHLVSYAAPSLPPTYCAAINGLKIGLDTGSCGTAAFCKHPIYVSDIALHSFWTPYKELALQAGVRACWSVPLLDGSDRLLGTFGLYYREVRAPTEIDRLMIRCAADTVAALIVRARETF